MAENEHPDSLLVRLNEADSFVPIEDIVRQHKPLAAVNLLNDLIKETL
jgi:hypothetical protein